MRIAAVLLALAAAASADCPPSGRQPWPIGGDSIATLFIQTSEGFFLRENDLWIKRDPRISMHRRLYAPGEKASGELRMTMVGLRR